MKNKRAIVTGSAGFIGSYLSEALTKSYDVIGIDNFSSGKIKNVPTVNADLLLDDTEEYFKGTDIVFHFAANPDVRLGATDAKIHIEQNLLTTHNLLEAMRKGGIKKIVFASSSAVYGNANKLPTPENYSPLHPISLYGASKLACESLICAYCGTFGMQAWIFRLANIIGPRSDHGIIPDFIKKFNSDSRKLEILGDGKQNKSYLYISDCVDAIIFGFEHSNESLNVFNVGSEDQITVKKIAENISSAMKLNPKYYFIGGKTGWKGDVPIMLLDTSKLKSLGWKPHYSSAQAVEKTILEILSKK